MVRVRSSDTKLGKQTQPKFRAAKLYKLRKRRQLSLFHRLEKHLFLEAKHTFVSRLFASKLLNWRVQIILHTDIAPGERVGT